MANGVVVVPLERARAFWQARAGLARPSSFPTLENAVAATGWVRTLGGVDAYIAVRARVPNLRRADIDAAVARRELQAIPAVRGCIYLVPLADVPLALQVAGRQFRPRAERELEKAGVKPAELRKVADAALQALAAGPLTPDALRKVMPAGSVRSLGEAGKKAGLSSPLPTALRTLEFEGRVTRVLPEGRLDTERYAWALAPTDPFARARLPEDATGLHALLAARFFRWAGPASRADFAEWSGLAQREAAAAIAQLRLAPVAVEGYADEAFVFPDDLDALAAAKASPRPALLSFEDNAVTLHGGARVLTDPRHHARKVESWGMARPTTLGEARHVSLRPIFRAGVIAGFWEYDPRRAAIVHELLDPLPKAALGALGAEIESLRAFLADEVGHARSFALDTDEDLHRRASRLGSA
ncbi:MAG: winged helix DNA-binding domain-containing protein [Acidobacteria bacterium]|nr:winged helix DNA-binding domain-containing protein [Acidobacteriota bacterium]